MTREAAVMFALGRMAAALAAGRMPDPADDLRVYEWLLQQDRRWDGVEPDPADLAHLARLRRRAASGAGRPSAPTGGDHAR
ncbi:MAG TPA: hypothetical protein VMW49_06130 [Candidatus Dormibacteraeota bacterium]|nr:hypothetical protein [Candidatus Dormibacteraeota bacterium]HVA20972.1 hypothetical protein [Candidatus Micrarchaeia archaeon]